MSLDVDGLIVAAQTRLARSRDIAAAFRHDRTIHELLMRAVFALEDVLFALHEIAGQCGTAGSTRRC